MVEGVLHGEKMLTVACAPMSATCLLRGGCSQGIALRGVSGGSLDWMLISGKWSRISWFGHISHSRRLTAFETLLFSV